MISAAVLEELRQVVGPRAVLDRSQDLMLYEYDGSVDTARPEVVVFPSATEEVVEIVKIAARHKLPLVGRRNGRRRAPPRGPTREP